jgi:hypothetical protein
MCRKCPISSIKQVEVKKKHISNGWSFSCFPALCLAKMLALRRLSNIRGALARRFVITPRHVQHVSALVRRARLPLPDAPPLLCENLFLRQQLLVLKRRRPRPHLALLDKVFWVAVHGLWPNWKQALVVVTPETVAEKNGRIRANAGTLSAASVGIG